MCLSCGTRGGEGAAAARTPEGPGLQGAWSGPACVSHPWDPALGQAETRAGQGVCELSPRPLPAASHPLPNIRWPSVLGSGKVSWATNRLGSIAFFPLGTDRPQTPREDIGFCFKTQLLTKRRAGPASSPGRCTCGLALPLLVTFPCTGLEGSRQGAGGGTALLPLIFPTPTSHPEISGFREAGGRAETDFWPLPGQQEILERKAS